MKQLKSILLLALMLALLPSCTTAETPYTVSDAKALIDAGAFDGDMQQVQGSFVTMVYGVDDRSLTDFVSYQAANTSVSADEVTVLVLTDEEAARTAEEACHRRVESQIENCRLYSPAAIPNLEAAVIDRVGNTVLLAVGNPDRLPDAVKSLHK